VIPAASDRKLGPPGINAKAFGQWNDGPPELCAAEDVEKLKTLLQAVHLAIPRSMLMSAARIGLWQVLHCSCIVLGFLVVIETFREEREPMLLRLVLYRQFAG
jgi:hypothetical protein